MIITYECLVGTNKKLHDCKPCVHLAWSPFSTDHSYKKIEQQYFDSILLAQVVPHSHMMSSGDKVFLAVGIHQLPSFPKVDSLQLLGFHVYREGYEVRADNIRLIYHPTSLVHSNRNVQSISMQDYKGPNYTPEPMQGINSQLFTTLMSLDKLCRSNGAEFSRLETAYTAGCAECVEDTAEAFVNGNLSPLNTTTMLITCECIGQSPIEK